MPKQATRVLITGVAGFVGSNLADFLLNQQDMDYQVTGLDNLAYGVREQVPSAVEFHEVDIRDRGIYALFNGVDYVYHLAAKNCISDCQQDPVETVAINVGGTTNVMEACRLAGVKKLIYAESSALYEGSSQLPTPETEVSPRSFYAVSKLASMHMAEAYARFFELNSTALRYFCVYGPRQDYRRTIPPVMSAFIIKLLRGERPIIYGDGSKRRDFVHVRDINHFHLQCMTDPRTDGQAFNLGSGRSYSIRDIHEILCDLLAVDLPCEFRPDLPGEAQETLADITLARSLGWQPTCDIRSGLQEMITYIRAEIERGNLSP